MFPCISSTTHYGISCISAELLCDGYRNCPFSGNDEDQLLCDSNENFERIPPMGNKQQTTRHGLQFLASEMLKRFMVGKNNKKADSTAGNTEKSTVLWFEEETGKGK